MKVKLVEFPEKGIAEKEAEFQQQYEEQLKENTAPAEPQVEIEINQPAAPQMDEKDIVEYISNRFGKKINSVDELMQERNSEELPEDVSAFLKYKKDTGRGIEDFIKLNKDYSGNEEDMVREYLLNTNDGYDREDIEMLMDEYDYNEDYDDEQTIKKAKLARKKVIAEAKKYFDNMKSQYMIPLESKGGVANDDEEYKSYKQNIEQLKQYEEENQKKRDWFETKTKDLFGNEFKGFEFNINDKKILFNPSSANELISQHSNPGNFINKFLDENGLIKDAAGYHKSLAAAMNTDRFAKFFYEQGKSDATDELIRKTKNISMSENQAPQLQRTQSGISAKDLSRDDGNKIKIRSAKIIK
jgi:hypothetical protein